MMMNTPRAALPGSFRIQVDDDGPGLAAEEREEVLRRGKRLDESKPGTGLGLSIVLELAKLYGGSLQLGASPLGGLRAELVLPAA
jgi:signal transduction histidine kinase